MVGEEERLGGEEDISRQAEGWPESWGLAVLRGAQRLNHSLNPPFGVAPGVKLYYKKAEEKVGAKVEVVEASES